MISFRVYGTPVPQGSMKAFMVAGRPRLTSDNDKLKPWREAVKSAALEQHIDIIGAPVSVELTFRLPRPASYPKKIVHPLKKPDLDKLVRAVFDALTEASVWIDDSLVVDLRAGKLFATDDEPKGCHVGITQL